MARNGAFRGRDVRKEHAAYRAGETIRSIADRLLVTPDAVRKWFQREGYPSDLQAHGTSYRVLTLEALPDLHQRYMAGEPLPQIAETAGTTAGAVYQAFQRAGLATFRRGKNPHSRKGDRSKCGGAKRGGDWIVRNEHEHIIADGSCLLCDEKVA